MDEDIEEWRPCLHSSSYEVSNLGRVRSFIRDPQGLILKPAAAGRGHLFVKIHGRAHYVHVLVLEAFVGPRPSGLEACHWDDNPTNNALSNLRWDTPEANRADAVRNNRRTRKTRCRRGHELVGFNAVRVPSRQGPRCRACRRAENSRHRSSWTDPEAEIQGMSDQLYRSFMVDSML